MSFHAGARLGPYEIHSLLGAGGMGEVYRARDTRLDRTVALKVLLASVASDPDLHQRFDREARALSALDDPHICALYDVGHEQDVDFLVMQYLEGQTLADRGAKGPLPLTEALTIAIQIAAALDTAHRAGIVHRDLKPANVMLTKSGAKLLDFGLAKAKTAAVAGVGASVLATTPPNLTAQGTILGTFQYMAPEQIEGADADARTDIFAFGCVLYEMVTGRKAFEGKTPASVLAAILEREPPPMSSIQAVTPPALDRVVKRCLAKDPDDRWQTARDLLAELKWLAEPRASGDASATGPATPAVQPAGWRRVVSWVVAGGLGLAVGVAAVLLVWVPWRNVPPTAPLRLSAELGADASLASSVFGTAMTLSPDGAVVAFVAQKGAGGSPQLYVRRLNQLQATPLSGTDDAESPFFSPDGQWIGFFAGGQLKKIHVTGGAAVTLGDAPTGRGGAWGEDGTIVFEPDSGSGMRLLRVSSAGGTPSPLTSLAESEVTQRWPQVLPGGKAVLFTSSGTIGAYDAASLVVQPLSGGARKVVQRGGYHGRYLPSGHLVYISNGTLFAAPFDLDRLAVTGQPVPALDGVTSNANTGGAQFAVSASGTLVYLPGPTTSAGLPIHWMDRDGKTTLLRATPATWFNPRFAPDGRRLALQFFEGQSDIWVHEWARDTLTRLTFDTSSVRPVWTPDGRRIVFASQRADKSTLNLYWQRGDGTGDAQRLTESKNPQRPASSHPTGKFLAFDELTPQTNWDLMVLPLEGDDASGWKPGKPTVFLNTPFAEREPMFSPDGRWLAYLSNESGPNDVYVRPFPGPGGKWQISTGGASSPTWSRTKQELFYGTNSGQIMVAAFTVEADSFRAEKPRPWSDGRFVVRGQNRMFDLHSDGERFALTAQTQGAKQDKIVFLFNFFDELRRIAPVKK